MTENEYSILTRRESLRGAVGTLIGSALTTASVTAQEQVDISLVDPTEMSQTTVTADIRRSSQSPQIQVSEALSYDNGANYEFVISDIDTGGKITTIPPIQETTDSAITFHNPDRTGVTQNRNFWPTSVSDSPLDADVSSTGSITTDGVANLRVSIHDATTGDIIDQTETQPYIIGYVHDFSYEKHNDLIEISVNRSSLPANSSVTAAIHNDDSTSPNSTDDKISVSLNYDESVERFVGAFESSDVGEGEYDIDIEAELPPQHETTFSEFRTDVVTVGEEDEKPDPETNDSIPGFGVGSGITALGISSYLLKARLTDNAN